MGTTKALAEKAGGRGSDLGCSVLSAGAREAKPTGTTRLHQDGSFWTTGETDDRTKWPPVEWEETLRMAHLIKGYPNPIKNL